MTANRAMIETNFIIRPEWPDRFDILKGSITTKWAERQPSKINATTTDEKELNDAVVWIQWYLSKSRNQDLIPAEMLNMFQKLHN